MKYGVRTVLWIKKDGRKRDERIIVADRFLDCYAQKKELFVYLNVRRVSG